jgi:hypothetical protein
MEADKILEGIKAETTGQTGLRYTGCKNCAGIGTWDMSKAPPTTCEKCNTQSGFVLGMSIVEVREKLKTGPAVSEPPAPPTPTTPPTPPAEQPKTTRTRVNKPKATETKTETATETKVEVTPTADLKELRKQAIDRLVAAKQLNQVDFKPVGRGTVFTLGFTRWVENEHGRVPTYCFKELTDDSQSFRQLLDSARRLDGTVKIDVAMISSIEPNELCETLFGGQLVAGLFTKTGPLLASIGSHVEIGARVTKTGGLVFQILKVN